MDWMMLLQLLYVIIAAIIKFYGKGTPEQVKAEAKKHLFDMGITPTDEQIDYVYNAIMASKSGGEMKFSASPEGTNQADEGRF
jgi:hypothetical protein